MKVTHKRPNVTPLSDLNWGDVFVFTLDKDAYMLINDGENHDNGVLPCIRLTDGYLNYINEDLTVLPYYDAEMILAMPPN